MGSKEPKVTSRNNDVDDRKKTLYELVSSRTVEIGKRIRRTVNANPKDSAIVAGVFGVGLCIQYLVRPLLSRKVPTAEEKKSSLMKEDGTIASFGELDHIEELLLLVNRLSKYCIDNPADVQSMIDKINQIVRIQLLYKSDLGKQLRSIEDVDLVFNVLAEFYVHVEDVFKHLETSMNAATAGDARRIKVELIRIMEQYCSFISDASIKSLSI